MPGRGLTHCPQRTWCEPHPPPKAFQILQDHFNYSPSYASTTLSSAYLLIGLSMLFELWCIFFGGGLGLTEEWLGEVLKCILSFFKYKNLFCYPGITALACNLNSQKVGTEDSRPAWNMQWGPFEGWGQRDKWISGAHWPDSLLSSRFSERLCLKKKCGLKVTSDTDPQPSHTCGSMYTHHMNMSIKHSYKFLKMEREN